MINTITKHNKSVSDLKTLFNNMYLLPNWEKIKEFSLTQRHLFSSKSYRVNLFRKFSSKNLLEKYSLRTADDVSVASIDLKIYKDSVYIISIDADIMKRFNEFSEKLLQVAAEKALYNTTNKEVKINLSMPLIKQNRMKHLLLNLGFEVEKNQSKFEIDMFGETLSLNVQNSAFWQKVIKNQPILINK